ncbi:hypothetical protein G6F59_016181 [Rhizopus arrhizus]|nr:hypothetical protein G6F59_016181 [Rhizopus arrhizus]
MGRQAFQPRPLPAPQQGRLRSAGSRSGRAHAADRGWRCDGQRSEGFDVGRYSAAGQCRQLQPHAALVQQRRTLGRLASVCAHWFCHAGAYVLQRLGGQAAAQPPGQRLRRCAGRCRRGQSRSVDRRRRQPVARQVRRQDGQQRRRLLCERAFRPVRPRA